jgi:hypothetical protein
MITRKTIAFILARNIGCCLLFIIICASVLTAGAKGTFSIFHPGVEYGFLSGSIYSLLFIIIAIFCYVLFISLIGAKLAFDSHRYFSNAELRKVVLYFLSVIPPVIVSQYLIRSHGSISISIITAYFVCSFIINYALKHLFFPALYEKIKSNSLFIAINLVFEIILFFGVLFLMIRIKKQFDFPPPFNPDDQRSLLSWYARILFIVVFNCINYISVEYICSVFSLEMKKPHVKSYFLYNQNGFKRFKYIIRTAIPAILAKIRFYLAWFIGFILFYEMDNNISYSIGAKIGNQTDINYINGVNIFSIFIVIYGLLCILNIIIDVLISGFGSSDKEDKEQPKFPQGQADHDPPKGYWKKVLSKNKLLFGFIACLVLSVSIVAVRYSGLYTILQHYDFPTCQRFDVRYVMDEIRPRPKFDDDTMADEIMNRNLCLKERGSWFTSYNILEFTVEQDDGRMRKVIPVTEAPEDNPDIDYPDLFLIVDNQSRMMPDMIDAPLIKSASYTRTVTVPNLFEDVYVPFSLERDSKGGPPLSSYKLFFPILVYYGFYLFLTAAVVFFAVFIVYRIISKVKLSGLYYSCFGRIVGKVYEVVKLFIISTPFVTLIAFSYLFFPQDDQITGIPTLAVFPAFTESIFLNSIIVYLIFDLVLIIYTIPGIYDDGKTFTENILKSREFKYLADIGLGKKEIGRLLNQKYGNRRILQVFVENLLFILVLQFFIMYCYSRSQFIDVIGVGSVMSIENVASKVYRAQMKFTLITAFHYAALFLIYGVIYAVTKIHKEKT